jgi:hypothetical protein
VTLLVEDDEGATTTWSAPPLIWRKLTVIAGCSDGRICFWDWHRHVEQRAARVESSRTDAVSQQGSSVASESLIAPDAIVDARNLVHGGEDTLNQSPGVPIVQLVVAPPALLKGRQHEVVVAVTSLGIVCIVDRSDTSLKPELVFSWWTGRLQASCVTVTEQGQVIVGYRDGSVEAWRTIAKTDKGPLEAQLLWRVAFRDESPVISSVLSLQVRQQVDDDDKDNDGEASKSSNVSAEQSSVGKYLVLTLQYESQSSTATQLEVIDLESVETAYNQLGWEEEKQEGELFVPLEDHWIFPEAGREIVDAGTAASSGRGQNREYMPSQTHWIPSLGTNCLCPIATEGSSTMAAAALADGTVLVLSAHLSEEKSLVWGVSSLSDQLVLSYPAIGAGRVQYRSRQDQSAVPHVACCLRGGTTYLVPIRDSFASARENKDPEDLLAIALPHDVDVDTSYRYVQAFAAGDLAGQTSVGGTLPVLLYAMPGGIMEIYSCELLPKKKSSNAEELLLGQLVANGSATILKTLLLTLDKDELEKLGGGWAAAQEEVLACAETTQLTPRDICSDRLKAFRAVLVLLSS